MNARLGYQLTRRLTLAVTATQLNSAQIIQTTGSEPERRLLFSATCAFCVALAGARPLEENAFKVELARRTLVRALHVAEALS